MITDYIPLQNENMQLKIARSIGPRILWLSFKNEPNLLAELPGVTTLRPDGKTYAFYGGHRLWLSPEDPILSYSLDDRPVEIIQSENGLKITKPAEADTGIEKTIQVVLPDQSPKVMITHQLKNCSPVPVKCAAWAITQLRTGGSAILPMNDADTGFLPNRNLTLWSYTNLENRNIHLGRRFLLVNAAMRAPFKIGFANTVGWLAYWLEDTLFVKSSEYNPQAVYPDFGCSSECYCNDQFIELETLSPLQDIQPGDSIQHIETWDLHRAPKRPRTEDDIQRLIEKMGLNRL
jgi:hypothetical protein